MRTLESGVKILLVLPRMVSGGVERVTLNLIEQFTQDGVECRLALRHCRGELLDQARALVPVDELAPRGMYQFVPALNKVIRRWQPTYIVTAFADVATLTWAALRLAKSRPRWIHGVHNTHASVIARPGVWGGLRYRIDNKLAGFVYRHADAIVAVSEGVRMEVLDQFRVDPARVTTIYNPVVPDAALRAVLEPRHPADQNFRIVAVGRLSRQKGFDVLIQAMSRVPMPWRLDIWGEGPERPQLQQLISKLGLDPAIHLRGYTPDPFGVLREADLFVLPSRYEGLGNTLIEALTCQCQIVATDCPHGPREILQGGELGQLVRPGNPDALAGAIRKVMTGQCRIDPLRLLTRAKDFSWHAAYGRWREVLQGDDGCGVVTFSRGGRG